MAKAAANRDNSEYNAEEGIWTIPQVEEARVDDVEISATPQITYSTKEKQTNIPEEYHQMTRASKRRKLLSVVDISVSCLTSQQAASRTYPLGFLTNFAGSVLDDVTCEMTGFKQLTKRPEYECYYGYKGMSGQNNGTDTLFFINKSKVPPDR